MNHHNWIVAIKKQRCISFVCCYLDNETVALAYNKYYNDAVSLPSISYIFCAYPQMNARLVHSKLEVMFSIVLVLVYALKFLLNPVLPMSCNGCLCYLGCGM